MEALESFKGFPQFGQRSEFSERTVEHLRHLNEDTPEHTEALAFWIEKSLARHFLHLDL